MLIYNDNSFLVFAFPEEVMAEYEQDKSIHKPAGYTALIERYDLDVISNWHKSLAADSGIHRVNSKAGVIQVFGHFHAEYPPPTTTARRALERSIQALI